MNDTDTTAPQADDLADQPIELDGKSQAETTTETAEASADETQPDPKGEGESVDAPAETDEDGNLNLQWLAKAKGVDINDPKAVADAWRKAEQEFHKTRQDAKNQLHTAAQEATEGDDVAQLRTSVEVLQFYAFNPEARELDAEMSEIVKAKPYLAADLDTVFKLAKADRHDAALKAAESKGREAAKTEIARSSAAAMPKGNASGPTPKETVDPELAAFDAAF